MSKLAIIGTGNMGYAMALAAEKKMSPDDICVADPLKEKVMGYATEFGCRCTTDNTEAAAFGKYVIVAVKVFILPGVLEQIRPVLEEAVERGEEKVLIPIAAGVSIEKIKEILGEKLKNIPIVRVLPTVYAYLGCGLMSCSVADEDSRAEFEVLKDMLSEAGTFELMPENMIDLASTASGCTPAFTAMFIEAMADGMVMMGMPRTQAVDYVARGVYGGAALVLEKSRHPGEIKDAVCSPGGSTIVGVNTLEINGFRGAAMEAIHQAALKVLGKRD
ncbi:pyrroline-5-carboxylate reductase [Lachnospiraceae bacterium 38-10]